eukprot:Amastigsp_a80_135.p1 type:complete len:270 gc:universal Amastigsp_a80_135:11-820(+)
MSTAVCNGDAVPQVRHSLGSALELFAELVQIAMRPRGVHRRVGLEDAPQVLVRLVCVVCQVGKAPERSLLERIEYELPHFVIGPLGAPFLGHCAPFYGRGRDLLVPVWVVDNLHHLNRWFLSLCARLEPRTEIAFSCHPPKQSDALDRVHVVVATLLRKAEHRHGDCLLDHHVVRPLAPWPLLPFHLGELHRVLALGVDHYLAHHVAVANRRKSTEHLARDLEEHKLLVSITGVDGNLANRDSFHQGALRFARGFCSHRDKETAESSEP